MSRTRRPVSPGDVLLARIAENVPPGHEQQGTRPVVVIASPSEIGPQRFPVVVVVPLTRAYGAWAKANPLLYPRLAAGQGGLPVESTALVDHVQAVDATRVLKRYGTLDDETSAPIRRGLERLLGFGSDAPASGA